jgi:hypothetical protein
MFLQQARQLGGREMAVGKPLRIVMVPNQAVPADLHSVSLREADDFIGLAEVEGSMSAANHPPLHRIFRFDHIEFARQRG